MSIIAQWTLNALLLNSTAQPEPITWSTVLERLQQFIPISWLWVALSLIAVALLFLLDVGDKLSGILGWLGIESPSRRSTPSENDQQKTRSKLLQILQREIDYRLETSLHERVKLDLYMEDQRQRVGKPKPEVVPQDRLQVSDSEMPLLNRLFQPFRRRTAPLIQLKSTEKILEVFDRADIQGKLLLLGEPGSGKTTELLHLGKDLVKRAAIDDGLPIPLILELSAWSEGRSIQQWVADVVKEQYGIPESITHQWLQQDDIILLLDGLDELGLLNHQNCIGEINTFLAEKQRYGLVVCCRREEYEASQVQLNALNGAVYLEPLREEQIQTFFNQLDRPLLWEHIRDNSTLLELAQSPLFLSMLVVAYQGKPITSEEELFAVFIARKLQEDSTGVYPPNREPDPDQTRVYLVWLAQQLESVRETEFLIEGLQPSLLSQYRKGLRYKKIIFGLIDGFISGLKIGLIIGSVVGLCIGLLYGLVSELKGNSSSLLISRVTIGVLFGLFLGLLGEFLGGLFLGLLGGLRGKLSISIQPIEKLTFSFSNGLIGALIFGLLGGVSGLLVLLIGLGFWLHIWLIGGLIGGFIGGLFSGFRNELINEKNFPNQGIWRSLQNSIIVIVISWLVFGLVFGLSFGLRGGLIGGLIFGLNVGLVFGLEAAIKHFVLRILLTIDGHTPWNYARFLDHAVELRFMQRVGGRYRFVHGLLRKHFAVMSLE